MKKFVSIKWKFLGVCLIFLTLPTAVLGILIYQTYYREALENMRRDLILMAKGWYSTADIYHEEMQRILKREQSLVEKRLESLALNVKLTFELFDRSVKPGTGPDRFQPLLDKLADVRIGRSGYIFIIDGDGNYILSKDRKSDGKPAWEGQREDSANRYKGLVAQARNLKNDEVKILHYAWVDPGQADERMKVAALVYMPKQDLVIGVSTYYTDFKSYELERILAEELKERMADQKIGAHGYVFAIDQAGKFIVSKDRLRDGENVADYRDNQGLYFFRTMLSQVKALPAGQALISRYTWKDLEEDLPHRRLVAVVYHPGWGWVIGASASEQDFLKGLAIIRWNVIQTCLGFIILGTLVALFLAAHISRPIRHLEMIAVKGDLNAPMDPRILASDDEIGSLGLAFEGMMKTLREKIDELERSRKELVSKNEALQQAQEQLIQSEKLAAIGQLAAGVAHEINNPLAYVMSNMQTLEEYVQAYEEVIEDLKDFIGRQASWATSDDARADLAVCTGRLNTEKFQQMRADVVSMLAELQGGLSRVKRIVMDLRTFARTEYEGMAEVKVEEILEQAINIVWGQVKYNAELVRDYHATPPVKCQSQRIGQVFMNILVNAAQAIKNGRGRIIVRTHAKGPMVCVDIIDDGEGIPKEHMSRIFEPFFSTKPVGSGTGLGLSISYEIVKKHGGDIRVQSDPGKKTTFTVMLPADGGKAARS